MGKLLNIAVFGVVMVLSGLVASHRVALPKNIEELSPALRWLATEKLRGGLMHRAFIGTVKPKYLQPIGPKAKREKPASLILRGTHILLIRANKGENIEFDLEARESKNHFEKSIYALFDPKGELMVFGEVPYGKSKRIKVKAKETGEHIVLLNPAIASGNIFKITPLNRHWVIEAVGREAYHSGGETDPGTPLMYHILRDMKLAGMNTLMLDFRHLDFATDEALKKWTKSVERWGELAKRFGMRLIPAVDLGGSPAEVEAWGDSPKGLYIEHFKDMPLAPCPLSRIYWERIFLKRGREVARLSLRNPAIVGYGLDPEMYMCWNYGHYMLSGTCFCDHCLGGFLNQKKLSHEILQEKKTGKERYEWLKEKGLFSDYDKYLEEETCKLATWLREELHKINPNLLFVVYVLEIGNWSCRGLARGLGTKKVPVINFCEGTYWVGYGDWAERQMTRFKEWGAYVLHGGGMYPGSHPPTKPGYLSAHIYNFALRTGGYWIWPMDYFLSDWEKRHLYYGQPAVQEDYWAAIKWANEEIDKRAKLGDSYISPLEKIEPHPVWNPEARQPAEGVEWKNFPFYPVHLADACELYLCLPKRARQIRLMVCAPGEGNAAVVSLFSPDGELKAKTEGELEEETPLEVKLSQGAEAGVWRIKVERWKGAKVKDLALRLEGVPPYLSASKSALLAPMEKKSSLVGFWRFDEGKGEIAKDSSGSPPNDGTVQGAKWTKGKFGSALSFENNCVTIPHNHTLDNLPEFTIQAWVNLRALPTPGNGGTIINKGPEAPVQHFWLWIGYPPNYPLILEMGNEKYQYGFGFSTDALAWELNRWYLITVTFKCDGKTSIAQLYRDGELIKTVTKEDIFHSGNYDLCIGKYSPGWGHYLIGSIDEVKIWDRALTAEEIKKSHSGF